MGNCSFFATHLNINGFGSNMANIFKGIWTKRRGWGGDESREIEEKYLHA